MPPAREVLMVFTRWPEPGRVKTRLIPVLGAAGAAELQRRLTIDTLARARALSLAAAVTVQVWHDGGAECQLAEHYGSDWTYRAQNGPDLGARMLSAFREALAVDRARAVLIGTDCPSLSPALMRSAFDALSRSDLVLGPARDGGYYLIGLCRPLAPLFQGIAWGTGTVREQTLAIARALRLTTEELPVLDDVDRPEDLGRLDERLRLGSRPRPAAS